MPGKVLINGEALCYEAIQEGRWKSCDAYAQEVLVFIRSWLDGQQSFSLTTSGTTGQAKRLIFSRAQLETGARASLRYLNISVRHPFLAGISVRHVGGMMQWVRAFLHGAPFHAVTPSSYPFDNWQDHYALVSVVPPQVYEIFSKKKENLLERIHTLLVGGGTLSVPLREGLSRLGKVRVYESFGMTETLSHIALRRVNGEAPQKYFHLLPEVRAETDAEGCLIVRSPATNHEPVYTRDVVKFVDAGCFLWVGRKDDIVNTGGVKFSLAWLEREALGIFNACGYGNFRCFFHPFADEKWGQVVWLFLLEASISAHKDPKLTPQFLRQLLRERLPKYAVPSVVHFVPELAYTPTQKIDKTETLSRFFRNEGGIPP